MALDICLQQETICLDGLPSEQQFCDWVNRALVVSDYNEADEPVELTIRIVDEDESSMLNATYRHKQGPTNVLSFPFQAPVPDMALAWLGDLVICAPLVKREAEAQHKSLEAHWAHLIVHGMLHLQGYDHQTDNEAEAMEALEITLLQKMGFPNPYQISHDA